jgi:hypothetical protein
LKALLIIIFICSSIFTFSQDGSCEPVKKGKYFYYAPNGGIVSVVRKRKKQIERYNNENQKFTFSIKQIDSCNYTLTLTKVKGMSKEQQSEIMGKKVKVEVISVGLDDYKLEVTNNKTINKNDLILYKN